MPAGTHKVVFTFKPQSIRTSETVAYTAIGLLLIGFLAALGMNLRHTRRQQES